MEGVDFLKEESLIKNNYSNELLFQNKIPEWCYKDVLINKNNVWWSVDDILNQWPWLGIERQNYTWLYVIEWLLWCSEDRAVATVFIFVEKINKTNNWIFIDWDVRIIYNWKDLHFSHKCKWIKLEDNMVNIDEAWIFINIRSSKFINNNQEINEVLKKYNNIAIEWFVLNNLKQNGLLLWNSKYEIYRNKKKFVLEAVKQNGLAIQFASNELKNDNNIIKEAICSNYLAFNFLSLDKRNNPEISDIYKEFKSTSEYIFAHNWIILWKKENYNARDNKDLVMLAVKQNWMSLLYASNRLKNDPDIVLAAVKQNWLAYQFIQKKSLKLSKEIVISAINSNINVVEYFWQEILNNVDFAIYIIKKQYNKYELMPANIKKDLNINLVLATKNILYAQSKSVVNYIFSDVRFIEELLRLKEREILNQVINMQTWEILFLCDNIKYIIFNKYKEVAIHWIHVTKWNILNYAWIKNNISYLKDLALIDSRVLDYFPLEIKNSPQFIQKIISISPQNININSDSFKTINEIISSDLKTVLNYLYVNWTDKIKVLLERIIYTKDLNSTNEKNYNLLMLLIEEENKIIWNDIFIFKILEQDNINVNQIWENGVTPLNLAIKFKRYSVAKKMLQNPDLCLFKLPKWNMFKNMVTFMQENNTPLEIINLTKNHSRYNFINKYL